MTDYTRPPGKTTIDPNVLHSIARLTALSVPGVARLAPQPGRVTRLFRKNDMEGVDISVRHNSVYADIFIVLENDINFREVSHEIQNRIARSISEMVGMEIGQVNIHIEDVDFNSAPQV
jgi:uncharacterized alkaline shock family protein YloU